MPPIAQPRPRWTSYRSVLQAVVTPEDSSWHYTVRDMPLAPMPARQENDFVIKFISVKPTDITLTFEKHKTNRILSNDNPEKFIVVSIANLRFEGLPMSKSADYAQRLLTAGITLNGTTYRFYGHSNSQLKSRTCFLYACTSIEEIDAKLKSLGDFECIMSVAKRAKRIGLLFSAAEMGIRLRMSDCEDIPDIEANGHVFTDGCGFMSPQFALTLSRQRNIVFRNKRYIPSVMQIRYKGYKGIVMIDPRLKTRPLVQFRDSMRKFKKCSDDTFSVLGYSKPYAFGRLNGELVTLLSSLGISDEVFLRKQQEYFSFIIEASKSPIAAFEFLSYCNRVDLGEKLAMEGLESVVKEIKKLQSQEQGGSYDKRNDERVRIMVRQSRLLYGVCDPLTLLREDQCHVRITLEGGNLKTLDGAEVIVARNPCLHPGDIRKLRAVHIPELDHLVDCIAFPVVGKRPAASMMSGGDLDGDKFFVCWDKDLIPSTLYEPYGYPPAKEVLRRNITHGDMVRYFARYNNASLGRVKNCYLAWLPINGAGSSECQQLNSLFSSCVDGEPIKIPQHLTSPPESENRPPFILDILCEKVKEAFQTSLQQEPIIIEDSAVDIVELLVASPTICLSEFELFQLTHRWARKNKVPLTDFLWHFDFNSFTTEEKYWIAAQLPISFGVSRLIFNNLTQSELLTYSDLEKHNLHWPALQWKRLYSSSEEGSEKFFRYFDTALEQFHRKLVIIRIDERLTVAIYIPSMLEQGRDNIVNDTVRLFAFTPTGLDRRHRANTLKGYQLFFDGTTFQLFQGHRRNTFVYMVAKEENKTSVMRASIALDKFNQKLQQHVGRVNRTSILATEIYVISNRDRVGQEILDISLNQVDTQIVMPLIENIPKEYELAEMIGIDWDSYPAFCKRILKDQQWQDIGSIGEMTGFEQLFSLCISHHGEAELVQIVRHILVHPPIYIRHPAILSRILTLLDNVPQIVIIIIDSLLGNDSDIKPPFPESEEEESLYFRLTQALIKSTATKLYLVPSQFDRLLSAISMLSLSNFSQLAIEIPLTVRPPPLAYELLYTLFDHAPRLLSDISHNVIEYFHRLAIGVQLDRTAEAAEMCPCDDWGVPTGRSEFMIEITRTVLPSIVEACPRIDLRTGFKKGDHIRLRAASSPINRPERRVDVLDGIIEESTPGKVKIKIMQPPPLEAERCSWEVLSCGSTITTGVMMDSLIAIVEDGESCCGPYEAIILNDESEMENEGGREEEVDEGNLIEIVNESMNNSQKKGVSASLSNPLTLIWGPPGTGKTKVVVEILMQLLSRFPDEKILVAASTHNAVDNVLERFLKAQKEAGDENCDDIIRVASEISKVSAEVKRHTLDAFVGGNVHDNFRARNEAKKRIRLARVIFTTCTGAGLGILREERFSSVIVDEASQLSEPNTLVPLVKGPRRIVLVGDHVQLRPTVRQPSLPYEYDTSLFERLYIAPKNRHTAKVMLDTQYRMHPHVAAFPSHEFYADKLRTGVLAKDREIPLSKFPWPTLPNSTINPTVFVQCSAPESIGHASKKNEGQARKCVDIVKRLLATAPRPPPSITILTPYTRHLTLLKGLIPSVPVSTIDAFQGRESDIIVFSTVRSNSHGNLGFLDDPRRLNVALTRAKLGVIVVGDKETLISDKGIWERLITELGKVSLDTDM